MSRQYVHEENMTIPQGTDFVDVMSITQRNGDAFNLSEINTFAGKMRDEYAYYNTVGVDFTVSLNHATNGRVRVSFASSATSDLKPGFRVYDIVGFTTSGDLWRLAQGKINLTPRVY